MRSFLLLLPSFLFLHNTTAQVSGGRQAFSFLEMPASARLTALGGYLVSVRDDDVVLATSNPAQLNVKADQQLAFNHNFHLASTGNGYLGYGHHSEKWKTTLHGGIQYMRYGDIPWTNEFNQELGTFSPSEFAITIGAARQWKERLSYGVNLKYIQSTLEAYKATALGADAGVYYENPESRFSMGLVLQNIGGQMSTYYQGAAREKLPFNALLGVSTKLKYLPFRFSVTAHSLHRWNVRYDDPALRTDFLFPGQEEDRNRLAEGVDNLFRHLIFSGEFLLGKTESFRIRIGYDHRLRRELLVTGNGGLSGFSGGLGFRVYRFRLDYGFSIYHLAGAAHHLSIGTNLKSFFPGI